MTASPVGPNLQYVGTALFLLGLAYTVMRKVGRTVREQLGTGATGKRGDEATMPGQADSIPPMLVKRAIERGLVTASQLAAMAPMERQFFFATLKDRLAAPDGTVPSINSPVGAAPVAGSPVTEFLVAASGGVAPRVAPAGSPASAGAFTSAMAPAAPLAALGALAASAARLEARAKGMPGHGTTGSPLPPGSHAMNGAEFGMLSVPVNENLHMHCPMCGMALDLPAFAPYVGHCAGCGTRTAMREDVPGHYILNVAPALKPISAVAPASA